MAHTGWIVAAFLGVLGLNPSPAQALLSRAWVSGHGSDAAGCGSPANPCRSLQYVHDNVVAVGGEIDVLDPAGYGAVTLSKAVSIVNDGVGTAGVQASSGDAITISAGASDVIVLRGLDIDGLGAGTGGIVFNSGGALEVVNCVIRHFAANGIVISPSSGTTVVAISGALIADNTGVGLYFRPTGSGVVLGRLVRDELSRNGNGVLVDGSLTTGYAASNVLVSESSSNDNRADAYAVSGGATMTLTRSISTGNFNGIGQYNGSNNKDGVLQSYGDNRFVGNFQLNGFPTILSGD